MLGGQQWIANVLFMTINVDLEKLKLHSQCVKRLIRKLGCDIMIALRLPVVMLCLLMMFTIAVSVF